MREERWGARSEVRSTHALFISKLSSLSCFQDINMFGDRDEPWNPEEESSRDGSLLLLRLQTETPE